MDAQSAKPVETASVIWNGRAFDAGKKGVLKIDKVVSGQYDYFVKGDGYIGVKGTLSVTAANGTATNIRIDLEKDLLSLYESELNGKVLLVKTEKGAVSKETRLQDVYLAGAPRGLSIQGIQYVDAQSFLLELSYQGDIDTDVKNVAVFIRQKNLLKTLENRSVKTEMVFHIIAEEETTEAKTPPPDKKTEVMELYERYVNKALIVLKLSGGQFREDIGLDDLKVMGLPRGIDLKEVRYIDNTTIHIRLLCRTDITQTIKNIQFVLLAGGMKKTEMKEIIQLGKLVILPDEKDERKRVSGGIGN